MKRVVIVFAACLSISLLSLGVVLGADSAAPVAAAEQPALEFGAYDVPPNQPATFQINIAGGKVTPNKFVSVGESFKVGGVTYRVAKFERKSRPLPNSTDEEDVSELTLVNAATSKPVVLVMKPLIRAPASP
jgi:hypothetical protein